MPSLLHSPGTGPPSFLVSPQDESPLTFLLLRVGSSGPVSQMSTQGQSSGRDTPASWEPPAPAPVSTWEAPRFLPLAAALCLQNFHLAHQLPEPVLTLETASCPPATTSHGHPSGPPTLARPRFRSLWGPHRAPRGGQHSPHIKLSMGTAGARGGGQASQLRLG